MPSALNFVDHPCVPRSEQPRSRCEIWKVHVVAAIAGVPLRSGGQRGLCFLQIAVQELEFFLCPLAHRDVLCSTEHFVGPSRRVSFKSARLCTTRISPFGRKSRCSQSARTPERT